MWPSSSFSARTASDPCVHRAMAAYDSKLDHIWMNPSPGTNDIFFSLSSDFSISSLMCACLFFFSSSYLYNTCKHNTAWPKVALLRRLTLSLTLSITPSITPTFETQHFILNPSSPHQGLPDIIPCYHCRHQLSTTSRSFYLNSPLPRL